MSSRFTKTTTSFQLTQEEIEQALRAMEQDNDYNTASTYSANVGLYPDNKMSFAEKHMAYLKTHVNTNPEMYLSNLRLMTKVR
jgi:hypothetical protein